MGNYIKRMLDLTSQDNPNCQGIVSLKYKPHMVLCPRVMKSKRNWKTLTPPTTSPIKSKEIDGVWNIGTINTWHMHWAISCTLNLKAKIFSSLLTPSSSKRQQEKCNIEVQTLFNHELLNMYANLLYICPCAEGAQISCNQRNPNSH